jgi:hypothetical protein
MADKYLDTSVAFPSQATTKVDLICEMVRYFSYHVDTQFIIHQVSEEFPILLKFEGNWVIHDYLRIYLKNSAQKAKKEQQQRDRELETAAKGKGKAKGVSLVYTETTDGSNLILRSSSQITGWASLCILALYFTLLCLNVSTKRLILLSIRNGLVDVPVFVHKGILCAALRTVLARSGPASRPRHKQVH